MTLAEYKSLRKVLLKRTLEPIDIPDLDSLRNSPFCYRYHLPGDQPGNAHDLSLVDSVDRFGLIDPPLVIREKESPRVVLGHRRLAAATVAGFKHVEVMVVDSNQNGSTDTRVPADILSIWLENTTAGAELSDLEKIILLSKASINFGDHFSDVLSGLSGIFGRRLSENFAGQLVGLLQEDNEVLDALHKGSIRSGDLLLLSSHPCIDTSEAIRHLSGGKLSRAQQKESVRLIVYLADQGNKKWKIFSDEFSGKGRPLPDLLRKACYPSLSRDMETLDRIVAEIGLPSWATIQLPENLEGGSFLLNIRIRDEEKLRTAIDKIENSLESGRIARLLDILKNRQSA